jgi:hypothetical protein
MYDLTKFTKDDLDRCGQALSQLGSGAASMEEAASRIVRHLFDNTIDPKDNKKACALVRFYKTHAYEDLNNELRTFAQGILGHAPESPDIKCLTLLATTGEKTEWNSRAASAGHKAIPLPNEAFVSQIPMISRLVSQFGLDVKAVIQPDPNLLADLEQQNYNAFHVAEAVGSPYIPAQKDFVVPFGIRSVLGFGGMLATGDLFAALGTFFRDDYQLLESGVREEALSHQIACHIRRHF